MANPRKRKQRIREALQQVAANAKSDHDKDMVRQAAEIALRVGKLSQEEVNKALESIEKKEKDNAEKKQTTKQTTEKATKKRTTKKRTTKKRTSKTKA